MSEWQNRVDFRRTPWRWVRDLFDTTSYLHQAKLLRKRQKKKKPPIQQNVIIPEVVKEIPKEISYEINPADKNAYIHSDKIEDYAATSTPEVQVVTIPKPYFIPVPIPIKKYRFEVEHKIIKITLPKIKINMTMLKRWAFASVICSSAIITIIALIMFSRFIAFTDGDFVGETYRYKMAKYETDLVVPLRAQIQALRNDVTNLEAKKEFKTFEEMTGYKPPKPKIIIINKYYKNRKAPIVETISK